MPTGLWPLRPAPLVDELLTSWMARLAHGHGLRPAALLQILEPAFPDFGTLDWTAPRELLALLAMRTGVSHRAVETLVLAFASEPNLRELLHHNWQGPALQYCAACLAEEVPYYRRSWRLACFRVCPRHRTALCDACPHCRGSIRLDDLPPTRGLALCQNCGGGLAMPGASAPPQSALLEKLIDLQQRIGNTVSRGPDDPHEPVLRSSSSSRSSM
jgi:hypothetical protein